MRGLVREVNLKLLLHPKNGGSDIISPGGSDSSGGSGEGSSSGGSSKA
jgi:hypothetical protein